MDDLPETESRPQGETTLDRALRRSALALLAERLLRLGAGLFTLALFFLALSWLGLWRALALEARMAGVALFAFAALYLVAREIAGGLPRRRAAAARLDAAAQGPLKPAASLDDTLAAQEAADPATAALWALHRKRLEKTLARTPVAPPQPRLPERDPYALRAFAVVAAVAAAFVAGDEKRARLAAAFDWRAARIFAPAQRVDAWFDPPAYTGRPPIVLAQEGAVSGAVEAPVNSTLRLRPADAAVSVEGGLAPVETAENSEKKERAYTLAGEARLFLSDGRVFDVVAIPDRAPTIAVSGRPRNNARGTMTLSYRAEDDYGVTGAEAVFSQSGARRALYEPPRQPLELPAGAAGLGEGRATLDLADSPYAGAKVTMRLVAKDAAGNEGVSEPAEITLPQRRFTKPLAKALVEQRRILALEPDARANVRAALEALSLAPEAFDTPSAIHLGLRTARRSLEGRRTDDELRSVADMLWAMALSLEDGDASQAERDLRAAEQALREAMQKGAPEEEIAKRSQELRAALDKFLEQLGARPRPPGEPPREASGDPDSVTPEDLQGMLDDIEKAMRSGDMAQAQKLLDELQDIMENARTGDAEDARSAAQQQRRRDMQKALGDLDQLSREEQQLRDETFQGAKPGEDDPRKAQRGGKKGQPQASDDMGAERQRQQALREKLEREQDALKGDAGEAGEAFDDARKAMKEAEEAMKPGGEGRGKAVDAQGRAVEALRKGADKLAEQMRGQDGQEGEEGDEGEDGQGKRGRTRGRYGQGRDPLGRSQGGQRASHEKYDPLGMPPAQRAHRVQEELRRRLGQPERPAEELDYLQRLLRR